MNEINEPISSKQSSYIKEQIKSEVIRKVNRYSLGVNSIGVQRAQIEEALKITHPQKKI